MAEIWYQLKTLPDLSLNKYSSLEENGVDGVLEKHIAFLRQLNRKGIVSGVSFHLFYFYNLPEDSSKDKPGHRLKIFLMIKGDRARAENISPLINASPLKDFYPLECIKESDSEDIKTILSKMDIEEPSFGSCAFLTKTETLISSSSGEGEDYYMIRDWEMNEDGRLYNMCNMMEAVNKTALYRVDLYPVEKNTALRNSLKRTMNILRKKQEDSFSSSSKDYEGKDVLENYEEILEKFDSSPHFIANIMVFAKEKEDAVAILDAAGSESLIKGRYNIAAFANNFNMLSFLDKEEVELENIREGIIAKKGDKGLIICSEATASLKINYLPVLFSLEEAAPFFRFPALYDGEVIQIAKETAPLSVDREGSLFLGKDDNGYDVYFPLSLLPKHVFVSGVPGSGKTNTMHHITSSLWKDHRIPFLVLEPAKQEYRALANDPGMKELYVFSPNADMSFPLHINPFEMPAGTMVAEHIRRLCSVFEGAFPLEPPMPFLLDTAIESVYRELGWIPEHVYTGEETDEKTGEKRALPSMSMLYRRLEEELSSTTYSDEVRGNLESALKVRIGSLLRREMGDVFDVPRSTFKPEKWLEIPAVIELESMGTGPANFMTLMLCSLIRETLKVDPHFDGNVRHVIFIEEAHNLIGPESEEQSGADADPKTAATAFVVKMLAEVRALKEGIVIADQLPTVMAQEVLKNTGLKLGLRITSEDDRQLLGSTMAANAMQLEQMATFEVGQSLIFYEKLKRPFLMRIKEWWGELKNKQEKEAMVTSKNDADLRISLGQSETYRDENLTSISIILDKFLLKLSEHEAKTEAATASLISVGKSLEVMNTLTDKLYKVAENKLDMEDEKLVNDYDRLNSSIVSLSDYFETCGSTVRKSLDIMDTLCQWTESLERLCKGRWKRFIEVSDCDILPLQVKLNEVKNSIVRRSDTVRRAFDHVFDQIIIIKEAGKVDIRNDIFESIRKSAFPDTYKEICDLGEKIAATDLYLR